MNPLELIKSIFDFTLFDYLRQVWGNEAWVEVVLDLVGIVTVSSMALLSIFFWGLVERKAIARLQDRIGPNRVGGRYGQLQMVADVIKMITKEIIVPSGADKVAYVLAPVVAVATSLLLLAVMPFAPGMIGADINVGLLYVVAVSSVSVVAILLAGWGSNNKYAMLGAFRAVAQLISYEVPMVMSLLIPALLAGSLSTVALVEAQAIPFLVYAPLAGLIFLISVLAESGRTPFDIIEAESEIVAGYHTEYGGMNLGLFLAAEYISALFMAALFVTAFLGGYRFFGLETIMLGDFALGRVLGLFILFFKTLAVFSVFMWIRGTWPRFRIDQMMNFNWKFMVPLTLLLIFATAVLEKSLPADLPLWGRAGAHLLMNGVIGWGVMELVRRWAKQQRSERQGVVVRPPTLKIGIEEHVPAIAVEHSHH
jgi:NADH-quinone oxidoreductase subunit H